MKSPYTLPSFSFFFSLTQSTTPDPEIAFLSEPQKQRTRYVLALVKPNRVKPCGKAPPAGSSRGLSSGAPHQPGGDDRGFAVIKLLFASSFLACSLLWLELLYPYPALTAALNAPIYNAQPVFVFLFFGCCSRGASKPCRITFP